MPIVAGEAWQVHLITIDLQLPARFARRDVLPLAALAAFLYC